jgi:20S proteasome alpha/beta subunit
MLALKPHRFIPRIKRLPKVKLMTIAAGFTCADGLVLCADTQETIIGYAKVSTQKMTQIQTPLYNIAFTGSGDSGLIEMTVELMDQALMQKKPNCTRKIEEVLRESLVDTFNRYIVPGFQFPPAELPATPDLLIGLQQSSSATLYRASGATFRRVYESQCVGTGVVLGKSLIAQLFDGSLSVGQGWLVALYVLHQAKTWVDGCGGNTDILLLSNRNKAITRIPTTEVKDLENHFDQFNASVRPHTNNYTAICLRSSTSSGRSKNSSFRNRSVFC